MRRIRQENLNTASFYETLFDKEDLMSREEINPDRANAIYHLLPADGLIVDVGCWTGAYLRYWQSLNPIPLFYGLDFSTKAIEYAQDQGVPIHYKVADLTLGIPLSDGYSQATVVCSEVLEHMENPQGLADELIRVAGEGQKVIVGVPYKLEIQSPAHLWEFDESSLRSLFSKLKQVVTMKIGPTLLLVGTK